ncbi:acyl carrier protein [Paenibacillus cellulosilyticus]|nr:phosphopantetheine-binding protein [Paenibacillus cellulosilyticus]QKS46602.1 acyl carrier protein [Paenibacillus cellulosilyticus]
MKIKIRAFLGKYIRQQFEDQDHLFERGLVNSLFAMQLVTHLEKAYEIEVDNEDLEIDNFKSVDAICSFIAKKSACSVKQE